MAVACWPSPARPARSRARRPAAPRPARPGGWPPARRPGAARRAPAAGPRATRPAAGGPRSRQVVDVLAEPGHELLGHIRPLDRELDQGAQVVDLVAGVEAAAA